MGALLLALLHAPLNKTVCVLWPGGKSKRKERARRKLCSVSLGIPIWVVPWVVHSITGIFTVTHTMGWGGMVEARLAEASTRVGGYGLRVGSVRLPYPSRQKSEILCE